MSDISFKQGVLGGIVGVPLCLAFSVAALYVANAPAHTRSAVSDAADVSTLRPTSP